MSESTSVKPTISVDDISNAARTRKTMGIAKDGIYTMQIASVKDRDGTANVVLKTSKAGNRFLKAGLRFSEAEEYGSYVWADFIMLEGKSASYAKNAAGFFAALGVDEVPTIEVTGKTNPDKNGNTSDLVTLYTSNGAIELANRSIQVQLGSEEDATGKLRQTIVAFLPSK